MFRKEKELDQLGTEVRKWMEWKTTPQVYTEQQNISTLQIEDSSQSDFQLQASLFTEFRELFEMQKLYLDPELNLK